MSSSLKERVKRRASVQTGMFTQLLHYQDVDDPNRNSGAWIIGVQILQRNPGLEVARQYIKDKMVRRYERFRSSLTINPTHGNAEFEELDEEELDWDYHMPNLSFPEPFSKDTLFAYVGELNSFRYDLKKPLWRYLLLPFENDQAALILCVNHALGDGLSLVEVSNSIVDKKTTTTNTPIPTTTKPAAPASSTGMDRLAKMGVFLYGLYFGLTLALSRPDPPNRLRLRPNQRAIGHKCIASSAPISLERVKEVKTRLTGTTINDVFMGLMTLTLQRFFTCDEGKEGFSPGNKVTAQFPVSMRTSGEGSLNDLGEPHNQISYAYFTFDFSGKSRVDTVWKVKHQIDCIKLSPAPLALDKSLRFMLRLAPNRPMMDLLAQVGNLGTAQLSNVPSSSEAISVFDGIKVMDMSFFLFSPLAVYLGILTYNNQVNASFNLDSELKVDPKLLAKFWNEEFEALYDEVVVKECNSMPPRFKLEFYRSVSLGAIGFVIWIALALVLGGGAYLLIGIVLGVLARHLSLDQRE